VAETKKTAAVGEILGIDIFERRAERGEGGIRRLSVRRVCFDEKIDILMYSAAAREK